MPPQRKKIGVSLIGKGSVVGGGVGGDNIVGGGVVIVPEKEIFNEVIRRVLVQWLKDHRHHPYATEGETSLGMRDGR